MWRIDNDVSWGVGNALVRVFETEARVILLVQFQALIQFDFI